jgi:hypothetical protein
MSADVVNNNNNKSTNATFSDATFFIIGGIAFFCLIECFRIIPTIIKNLLDRHLHRHHYRVLYDMSKRAKTPSETESLQTINVDDDDDDITHVDIVEQIGSGNPLDEAIQYGGGDDGIGGLQQEADAEFASKLDLFSSRAIDTSLESGAYVDFLPLTALK